MRFKASMNQISKISDLITMIKTLAKYDARLIIM